MATVFVVGAGPAGLFAAQKLALAGHEVMIFNRDVKPGGLAEYGIYPVKDKMKVGLRKQFAKVLGLPNVHYFGHVPVGTNSPVSIDTLGELKPAAMVFAVGAQGTKKLGLPGEGAWAFILLRTLFITTTSFRHSPARIFRRANAWPSLEWAMSWWTSLAGCCSMTLLTTLRRSSWWRAGGRWKPSSMTRNLSTSTCTLIGRRFRMNCSGFKTG